jgi:hypothetical protein
LTSRSYIPKSQLNYNSYTVKLFYDTLHFNCTYPIAVPISYCLSGFIYTSLSFFHTILSHFCLYLIMYIHIFWHFSLFLYHTVLLIHISELIFLNLFSRIWSPQYFSLHISVCGSNLLPYYICEKFPVLCSS